MSTEHENGEHDELVSTAYRELGTEKAPERLNEQILRMAADNSNPGRSFTFLSAAWMKPVAWAATIGLSLAIVLEFTQLPPTTMPNDPAPAAETTFAPESFEEVGQQSGLARQEAHVDESAQESRPAVSQSKPTRRQAAAEPANRMDLPASAKLAAPAPLIEEVIVSADADYLRDEAKEEITVTASREPALNQATHQTTDQTSADKRVTDQVAERGRVSTLAFSSALSELDTDVYCDSQSRESADDWLTCIKDLRATGATKEADLEYEAYILEYPVKTELNK